MEEIWKDIKYYPNYMVSNMGRVKSIGRWVYKEYRGKRWQREKILKSSVNKKGYLFVSLCKNGHKKIIQFIASLQKHSLRIQTTIYR